MSKGQVIEFHDEDYHTYTMETGEGQAVCRFEIDRVYMDKTGVWGEVTVWYLFEGEPTVPLIAYQRCNLINDRRPGIELLVARADIWPWEEFYERAKQLTVGVAREPTPVATLEPSEDSEYPPFLVEPFVLDQGVSLLFGPGGTGKSMLALSMGVSVASGHTVFGRRPERMGPVLYIDYEDTKQTHERRLTALLAGSGMEHGDLEHPIKWVRPQQSVSKIRRDLSHYMREHQPALVIIDSIGLARGGDAMGSDETIRMFSTLNRLPTAVLGIDHMTKEDQRGGKMLTPYGTIYTVNSVRLAWAVRAAEASTSEVTYLNLKQTKRNNVAAHEPLGAEVRFENEMVEFEHSTQPVLRGVTVGLTDVWWDLQSGSTIDKVMDLLADGNLSGPEIARSLGMKTDTLGRILRRHEGKGVRKVTQTSPIIWGLEESDE
jgi:hypothetical protein